MNEHFCKKCSCTKSVTEFSKVTSTYKGKTYVNPQSSCKECVRLKYHQWKTIGNNLHKKREKDRARERCVEEWSPTKSPIPWATLKGHSTIEKHTVYPIHSCGRRYMEQLGCLLCGDKSSCQKEYGILTVLN